MLSHSKIKVSKGTVLCVKHDILKNCEAIVKLIKPMFTMPFVFIITYQIYHNKLIT